METFTDHRIKINRALRLSSIGQHPQSAAVMLDAIPPSAIGALTAAQLSETLDAMWAFAQASKALAAQDACDEGAIWDARRKCLREMRT